MSKMKKVLLMCTAYILVAALAIGGTLAYFSDRDSEANVFTVGDVKIELNEDFAQGAELIPGVDIKKEATITNTGDNDAWVWLTVLLPEEMGPYTAPDNMSASNNVVHWNYPKESAANITVDFNSTPVKVDTDGDGETESYYQTNMLWKNVLKADDTTGAMLSKVYMDTRVDIDPDGNMHWVVDGVATDLGWNVNEKGNPIIHVSAYAIQTAGFDTVQDAYAAYQTQWGDNGAEYDDPYKVAVTPENINGIDFSQEGMTFSLRGSYSTLSIPQLGEGSALSFEDVTADTVTLNGENTIVGDNKINASIKVLGTDTTPAVLNVENANINVTGNIDVKVNDGYKAGQAEFTVNNSTVKCGGIFVGGHSMNQPNVTAKFYVTNSYLSCEENVLGSTVSVWGQDGVDAVISDSEIHTYSRGWHSSEDANDNAFTFQSGDYQNIKIERTNMHLYGARAVINARSYYGDEDYAVNFTVDDCFIWVNSKSGNSPIWNASSITDTVVVSGKNAYKDNASISAEVFGNPDIYGTFDLTTQVGWALDIPVGDGQTLTFTKGAKMSIIDNEWTAEHNFVLSGSGKIIVEEGASVTNIGMKAAEGYTLKTTTANGVTIYSVE